MIDGTPENILLEVLETEIIELFRDFFSQDTVDCGPVFLKALNDVLYNRKNPKKKKPLVKMSPVEVDWANARFSYYNSDLLIFAHDRGVDMELMTEALNEVNFSYQIYLYDKPIEMKNMVSVPFKIDLSDIKEELRVIKMLSSRRAKEAARNSKEDEEPDPFGDLDYVLDESRHIRIK